MMLRQWWEKSTALRMWLTQMAWRAMLGLALAYFIADFPFGAMRIAYQAY